jgi:hypothetical protein
LRYWKRIALVTLTGGGLLWVAFHHVADQKEMYTPGPVSEGHQVFASQCATCHTNPGNKVPNQACLTCHADLKHNEVQTKEPRCGSCHQEHRAANLVQAVSASGCADCHRDLHRKDGKKSEFASGIKTFTEDHPEFRFLQDKGPDTTAMKLNHKVHLKPNLEGPDGKRVQMKCSDCHEVNVTKDRQARYRNAPITHEKHCQSCHKLGFDRQFPEARAPHKKPEEVRAYVVHFYEQQLREHPDVYRESPARVLPGPEGRRIMAVSGAEWYQMKLTTAEQQLFGKACLECHDWKFEAGVLPKAPPFKMKEHYLKWGYFTHAAHRPMACASCHTQTPQSEKTSDRLVPGIKVCQGCHRPNGVGQDSCFECHRYHSRGPEKIMEGTLR